MEFKHKSVLLDETIEALNIKPDGIYLDGTLGGGGHSYEICRRLGDGGRLIGIDQDEAAIEAAVRDLRSLEIRLRLSVIITAMPERHCTDRSRQGRRYCS